MHCFTLSFMGSQYIFSNSIKPVWVLLFEKFLNYELNIIVSSNQEMAEAGKQ